MRVGIDATAFAGPRTGVGNYIAPLLVAMLDQQPQAQFLLYSNDDLDYPDHPRVMHRVSRPKRRGPYWQNTHLAAMIRQDRPDVLWAANGLAPVVMPRGTATVVTIHDLVYKYARDTLPPHSYAGRAVAQPMTARRADRLVAVSAATALDVRTYYGREADEIIHPIAEPQYNLAARHDVPRVRAALQLPDRFLLTAGTLEPRKNLTALLTAYLDVRARGIDLPPLLLAGRKGWRDNDIEQVLRQAEERGWARRLGYVPAPDMPGLYAAADVFVLPSLYEGFGMPLLEAQLCGTPVLHGPHASMTEACGGVGVQLGADAAGLARDLTAYAEGELPLACRTPHSIHNDAGEAAAKMWQQLAAAARGQRGAPRPGRAGSVRAPELRPCRALRHPAGAATSPGRPRLLILAPRLPYPVIGGDRLRIYQVARTLAKDYDLTLLSLCESQAELDMELPDDGVFRHVERILLPPWRSRLNSLRALPTGTPLQVAYYDSPQFRARARQLAGEHDAVLAHLIRTGHVVRDLPMPKFLEMTDAISLNYERVRSFTDTRVRDPRVAVYSVEFARLRHHERSMVHDFDAAFLVSQVDKDYLFGDDPVGAAKTVVCPNGVDLERLPYQFEPAGRDIAFIGNMCSLQNYDAAHWMATQIMPLIRRRLADREPPRLRLIGRITPEKAKTLSGLTGVDVTGEVPDVAVTARGCGVAVAPLRWGAGVQNKTLEYLALGLPTVTTSVALEGLTAIDGHDLLVGDSVEAIADRVVRVLTDRGLAHDLARNGRDYVRQKHVWDVVLAPMRDAIAAVVPIRSDAETAPAPAAGYPSPVVR